MSFENKPSSVEDGSVAIRVKNLSKRFEIYDNPGQRLKQFVYPRLRNFFGMAEKKFYKEFCALNNIDFEVKKGQTVGIIGKNGSGKSTLLQIICGTLHATEGEVEVNGRVAALLELGSGFNPEFTGRENVYFNARLLGQSEEITREKFTDIEAFADIGDFIDQPVKTYSSGMMVRLAFAVIAHVDADILIIDEALAVGDAFFTQKCMRYLRQFMNHGTVLFVSHDLGAVKNLCSEAVWINKGWAKYIGDSKSACDLYIEELFQGMENESISEKNDKNNDIDLEKTEAVFYLDNERVRSEKKLSRLWITRTPEGDCRADLINRSSLRNDIRVFDFNSDSVGYGTGRAEIVDAQFCSLSGQKINFIIGGEQVVLEISAKSSTHMKSPILGFFVKDRLGQNLFGDNTWLSYRNEDISLSPGQGISARFLFEMPRLHAGDYSVTVALAEGSQDDFRQHHWIHDALVFSSHSDFVAGGLIGLPMHEIGVEVFNAEKGAGDSDV